MNSEITFRCTGVIPVVHVPGLVVEVSDHADVGVALVDPGVETAGVGADRLDLGGQRPQPVDDRLTLNIGGPGLEGQQHNVTEHPASVLFARQPGSIDRFRPAIENRQRCRGR